MKTKRFPLLFAVCCCSVFAQTVPYGEQSIELSEKISPGTDFNQYVNANWESSADIPLGYPFRNAFVDVHLKTQKNLRTIVDELTTSKLSNLTHDEKNIVNLYRSYMDLDEIDRRGLSPLEKTLEAIETISTREEAAAFMAKAGVGSFVDMIVAQDEKDPTTNRLHIMQGGLSMARAYYIDKGEKMDRIRDEYLSYIATVFSALNYQDATERALSVFELETVLAQGYWSNAEMRDVEKMYRPLNLRQLQDHAPDFPWELYFDELGLSDKGREKIIVMTDGAILHLAKTFARTDIKTLRAYLEFHYVNGYSRFLPKQISKEHFEFYSRVLNGVTTDKPREETALRLIDEIYGEKLGKIYVDRYFPQENKEEMTRLIGYLQDSFAKRFAANEWMDVETKEEALRKLDQFTVKIGYPDRWHDTSDIQFSANRLIANIENINQRTARIQIAKIGNPVDSWEWDMLPQTVNAYYTATSNEIVFPAAILQPPFYSSDVDMAYNFGAIGAVIGHEIGHGFDDQGRMFDGRGVLRDWWTRTASKRYEVKTTQLVKQYSEFEFDGLNIDGRLTLGENLGDLGGLTIALEAYKQYCIDTYPNGKAPVIAGTTGIQRFFIAWAQVWREKATVEATRSRILSDPHAPNQFRINGIVRNIDEWYEAFNVTKDSEMYLAPDARVKIW
ncbi:M13 family metallopeptidase (plasmid) [Vibrio pelagius]|uniref:M13 family metallopeptidase n=1 Tax=Vibrio pelagius TaxID=28169 RepID=A0ABY5GA73_VIBPE|nr:M13 family metallopeptidase [Vibrio pelagius]UTT87115.1 M13 family metallopeptidase [Vibrio pelagius]